MVLADCTGLLTALPKMVPPWKRICFLMWACHVILYITAAGHQGSRWKWFSLQCRKHTASSNFVHLSIFITLLANGAVSCCLSLINSCLSDEYVKSSNWMLAENLSYFLFCSWMFCCSWRWKWSRYDTCRKSIFTKYLLCLWHWGQQWLLNFH